MKTRLGFAVVALAFVLNGIAPAQASQNHSKHSAKPAAKAVAKPGKAMAGKAQMMNMTCCCCQGGMMSMGMQGMKPGMEMHPGMGGMNQGGNPGHPPMMGKPMPPMDPAMMADMKASEERIQSLIKAMNDAPKERRLEAAIAMINALVEQQTAMHKMMQSHMPMPGMGASHPERAHPGGGQ
jgi:hypothetical protein